MISKRQQAENTKKLRRELVSIYGEDIRHLPGTVVKLYKQYKGNDTIYNPIAIKIDDGSWYMSGVYMTWEDLLIELDRDNVLEHGNLVDKAVDWEEVTNVPPF